MYILTKLLKKSKDGYFVLAKNINDDSKKNTTLHGNIPKLYSGMTVEFECEDSKIVSYNVISSSRNIGILEKHINEIGSTEDFFRRVDFHKELADVRWYDMSKSYGELPFAKADRIAMHRGKKPTDKARIDFINRSILHGLRCNDIHTFSLSDFIDAFRNIEKHGSFGTIPLNELMGVLSEAPLFGLDARGLYDKELFDAENYIKATMKTRIDHTEPLVSDRIINKFLDSNTFLSDDQKQAVRSLGTRMPDFITGGAGTGKTTTIKALIDCYSMEYEIGALCLLAPTGKASERMAEVIGKPASTIHSALRKTPDAEYVYYNENNPLPYSLFIVDEASMIDSLLMADLLKAVDVNSKIIFVGDCNQLPPVSCGRPFWDFLSGGRYFELKINHRQGEKSLVLKNAYHVLNDERLECGDDFIIKHIKKENIENYVNRDVQNLSPYNALNDVINQKLRHSEQGTTDYVAGDKIIALKNTKDYMNGDVFEVVKVDKGVYTLKKCSIKAETKVLTEFDHDDFMLAYSITIHKMQGSECDEIKLFLPENDRFVTRNMLYTAITRAKKRVELYYYI